MLVKAAGRGKVVEAKSSTLRPMTTSETSRFVRLRVELVLEIDGPDELSGAALGRIVAEDLMPDDERSQAEATVREDPAEALAYLVEPYDLVREVPGVELVAYWGRDPAKASAMAQRYDDRGSGRTNEEHSEAIRAKLPGLSSRSRRC